MNWWIHYAGLKPVELEILEKQGREPYRPKCSFEVNTCFNMFIRLDAQREFMFTQGMKKPTYKRITSRLLLDEIELSQCEIHRDYVTYIIDAMDSVRLAGLNR